MPSACGLDSICSRIRMLSFGREQLKAWVRERLAIFKTPVRIVFLDRPLPRNANGKILKKDLKALFGSA